jgi:hypothetical protein
MSKTNYLQAVISDLQRTAGPYRSARTGLAVPAGNSAAAASTVNLGHVDMTRPNRDN